jgi:inosine-uridine nucleoside N-ribohydrolase
MHDVCAIVPYVDASLVSYGQARVAIELAGTHTRGMTVCDLRAAAATANAGDRAPPTVTVALDVDGHRLIDLVIATLLAYA